MSTRREFTRSAGAGLGAAFGAMAGLGTGPGTGGPGGPGPGAPPDTHSGVTGWINVFDHGARGDGQADDTAAFQAAFDSRGSGVVYIPKSVYVIRRPIRVRGNFSIIGDGPRPSVIDSRIDDGGPVFDIGHADFSKILRGLRLADFTIRGRDQGATRSGGIRFHAVYDSLVQNVRLTRLGWGLEGHRAIGVQFDNLNLTGMSQAGGLSGEGVYLYAQSNACVFNKLRAKDSDGAGLRLGYGQSLTLSNPILESHRSTPIVVGRQQDGTYVNCRGVTILNPYFEKNRPYDMAFLRGTPPTLIQGYWGPLHDDYIAPIDYRVPFTAIGCDFPDAPGGAVRVDRAGAGMLFLGCTFAGEVASFTRERFRGSAAIRVIGADGDHG